MFYSYNPIFEKSYISDWKFKKLGKLFQNVENPVLWYFKIYSQIFIFFWNIVYCYTKKPPFQNLIIFKGKESENSYQELKR